MTNEELIRRFFRGKVRGDEESYGFYVQPLLKGHVGNFALFSKTWLGPMAIRPSEYYSIIAASPLGAGGSQCEYHNRLVITIAEQLGVKFVSSPHADRVNFHVHMEKKINEILLTLANDLRAGSYISVTRSTEVDPCEPKYALANKSEPYFAVPENYQKLMESIDALLEGERILELPKNQIVLVDTDEVQSMWRWLIKENPVKEDQELLREIYMLSRLLGSPRREEKDKKGGLIMISNPWK